MELQACDQLNPEAISLLCPKNLKAIYDLQSLAVEVTTDYCASSLMLQDSIWDPWDLEDCASLVYKPLHR